MLGNLRRFQLVEECQRDRDALPFWEFLEGFRPEWTLPAGRFSDWHVLVLDPGDNPGAYRYEGGVVVLMDEGCFSATDIFLGALAELPGVTLLGRPSGGGSARSRQFTLPNSGLTVQLASMASFRPDGRLYDGRGIEPDVVVHPAAEDFLGRGDRQLDAALELLGR